METRALLIDIVNLLQERKKHEEEIRKIDTLLAQACREADKIR